MTSEADRIGSENTQHSVSRLMTLFAVIYIAEGMGQMGGLIGQPLSYYLLKQFNWQATQISAMLYVLCLPWFIRPLYGMISDFVPLFGSRRKIYLVFANLLAVAGFALLTVVQAPMHLEIALAMAATGLAVSSTLCGAVLVENGKKSGLNSKFLTQQWLWYYAANIGAVVIGGQLCKNLPPTMALHTGAAIVSLTICGAVVGSWFLLREQKASVDLQAMKTSITSLWQALSSRTLWLVGAFIFCYYFSPGLQTPLFVHMTKTLHFDQAFIGLLSGTMSVGYVIGALLYKALDKRIPLRYLIYITISLGALAQLSYLFLSNQPTAIVINLLNGTCSMMAVLSVFTLAADHCPDGSEGFTYALLNSIHNATTPLSNQIGSYLYDNQFSHNLIPLVSLSAAITAFSLVLVPVLKLSKKSPPPEKTHPEFNLSAVPAASVES